MATKIINTSRRRVTRTNDLLYDETMTANQHIIEDKATELSQSKVTNSPACDENYTGSKQSINEATEYSLPQSTARSTSDLLCDEPLTASIRKVDGATKYSHIKPSGDTVSHSKKSNTLLKSKIQKFAKAGRADVYRIIHSSFGIASLVIGSNHLLNIGFLRNFLEPLSRSCIILTGSIHSMCGMFGVRRLKLNNKKEAARNAMFWPTMLQNIWFFTASLTEWGLGSKALLSMFSTPFILITLLGVGITFWQLSEVWFKTGMEKTKDSIWFKDRWKNAILVEFSYLIWIQIQMGAMLYTGLTVSHCDFLNFMKTFPSMHSLLSNLALNTAFFNNLVVFLATLLRYKIVSKPNQDNAIMFSLPVVTSLFIVWKVLACFFGAYGGQMSSSFVSLLFH